MGRSDTMKAMLLPEFGAPLRLETVPVPKIGPNDVLLRVRATGVGLTVVIMTAIRGRVTSFPRIPGHEVAGEVVETGSEVSHVAIGDRVVCHFYLTCKSCRFCRSGRGQNALRIVMDELLDLGCQRGFARQWCSFMGAAFWFRVSC